LIGCGFSRLRLRQYGHRYRRIVRGRHLCRPALAAEAPPFLGRPPAVRRAQRRYNGHAFIEPLVQISFSARFSTRKRMFQVARDHDVTLKALILGALREKYPALGIEDADLIDLRAKR
jgi:hypothetical protein